MSVSIIRNEPEVNRRELARIAKEGNKMKKMALGAWLILFLPAMVPAQEKIETPIWNVGDKWEFGDQGTIEVLKAEKDGYVVGFSKSTCIIESQGFQKIIFDKTSLQRIHCVMEDKNKKYRMGLKNIFNFPYTLGKQWTDSYSAASLVGPRKGQIALDYYEKFKILGWEDVSTRGGKFKALKMEVINGHEGAMSPVRFVPASEYKGFYWYSPEVKYFVKCGYDPAAVKEYPGEVVNWELTSFQLKK
jgi:hypothetical protein